MKRCRKTLLSLCLAAVLTGCVQQPVSNSPAVRLQDELSQSEESAGKEAIEPAALYQEPSEVSQRKLSMPESSYVRYPIEAVEENELKYWLPMPASVSEGHTSIGETDWAKKWQENTGIRILWTVPEPGEETEQFRVMISASLLPDIIEWEWTLTYEGGPKSARESGLVIPLNAYLTQEGPAADLWDFLQKHPWIDRQVRSDEGDYYCFPSISSCADSPCESGPIVRRDLLEACGIQIEELSTIDGLHQVLVRLKEAGIESPLTGCGLEDLFRYLLPAWNIRTGMFCGAETGEIQYGYAQREFRECMKTLAQWMEDGLIDPDIERNESIDCAQRMLNGESAVTFGSLQKEFTYYLEQIEKAPEEFPEDIGFQAAKYPALEAGTVCGGAVYYEYRTDTGGSASVTADCQTPELAARFLNYSYTKEGHLLMNYGTREESWDLEGKAAVYTDQVLDYEAGGWDSLATALAHYCRTHTPGPFVQDPEAIRQYFPQACQQEALTVWNVNPESLKTSLPPITLTQEEAAQYDPIRERMETYISGVCSGWLHGGAASVRGEWEDYTKRLEELNLDFAVEIFQKALDRYQFR